MIERPYPPEVAGWRQLLELGEQLMAAPSLAAQCDLILTTAAHLLGSQADLWLAETFHRLPGLDILPAL